MKATVLVGLDAHARQTHAAILRVDGGELGVSRLRLAPVEVVEVLERLGPGVVAVYEAGPTGFGLARAAQRRGIDVRVVAPGSIPKGPGDRVKTDRRDARRPASAAARPGARSAPGVCGRASGARRRPASAVAPPGARSAPGVCGRATETAWVGRQGPGPGPRQTASVGKLGAGPRDSTLAVAPEQPAVGAAS